jgi:hypothetical protein
MDEVDSVASPKTRPLAAAAMAEPVPTNYRQKVNK